MQSQWLCCGVIQCVCVFVQLVKVQQHTINDVVSKQGQPYDRSALQSHRRWRKHAGHTRCGNGRRHRLLTWIYCLSSLSRYRLCCAKLFAQYCCRRMCFVVICYLCKYKVKLFVTAVKGDWKFLKEAFGLDRGPSNEKAWDEQTRLTKSIHFVLIIIVWPRAWNRSLLMHSKPAGF